MGEDDPIITALAELARAWDGTPLDFSGPVSDKEITAAERDLGITFPRSYRAFLRHFGAGDLYHYEIYGLPSDRLWGHVVTMNQRASRRLPKHYLKFTDDIGDYAYYLDTSRMDLDGECPVVVFGPVEEGEVVAENLLDFLRQACEGLL
jgi:hypothetical protein